MSWDSTGTSSAYYTIDTGTAKMPMVGKYYIGNEKTKKKNSNEQKYYSEPLGKIVAANILFGKIAVFAHRESQVFNDATKLQYSGVIPYFDDPVIPGYARPTKLATYNFSIIIDALEYMPGKMAKANLIKESLSVLEPGPDNPFVIVLTKTRKMVEDLAKDNKYEELKDGFLVTDGPFKESIIRGSNTEDILELAHFARAKHVEKDILIKTDMTCIRIYLHKQG